MRLYEKKEITWDKKNNNTSGDSFVIIVIWLSCMLVGYKWKYMAKCRRRKWGWEREVKLNVIQVTSLEVVSLQVFSAWEVGGAKEVYALWHVHVFLSCLPCQVFFIHNSHSNQLSLALLNEKRVVNHQPSADFGGNCLRCRLWERERETNGCHFLLLLLLLTICKEVLWPFLLTHMSHLSQIWDRKGK